MSVLKDVEGRLTEAESQAADLIRRLEGLKSLEQSLGAAVQGLDKASANIGEFASEAGTAAKSLNETLAALRQAVEILQRSDPAKIHEELTKIGAQLESAAEQAAQVEAGNAEFQNRLLSELSDISGKLTAETRNDREMTADTVKAGHQMIADVLQRVSREHLQAIKSVKVIGSIALALIVLLALGFIWRLTQ